MICQGHLGGYVSGGDEATYYPDLWTWLVRDFGVRSVIDVGCGDGVAVRHFQKLLEGTGVVGVDGCQQENVDIVQHDFTRGPFEPLISGPTEFNLAWSCEFVEHVEERYMPNFLATFACAETVLMTHAAPGQAGWNHVNCRTADYWIGVMAAIGYKWDRTLTEVTRGLASNNPSPWNHFKRSGLAFARY